MTELEAAAEAVGQKVLAETDIYVGAKDEFSFASYTEDGWHKVHRDDEGAYVLVSSEDSGRVYRVRLVPEFEGFTYE